MASHIAAKKVLNKALSSVLDCSVLQCLKSPFESDFCKYYVSEAHRYSLTFKRLHICLFIIFLL
jgi:hypothetical protein